MPRIDYRMATTNCGRTVKELDLGETVDDFSHAHNRTGRNNKATEAYSNTESPVLRQTQNKRRLAEWLKLYSLPMTARRCSLGSVLAPGQTLRT